MVDYALVLSAPSFPSLSRASGAPPGHTWLDFVGRQHAINPGMPPSFNQTEYSPLRYSLVGLFVETKVDSGSHNEGRTQLAMWVGGRLVQEGECLSPFRARAATCCAHIVGVQRDMGICILL
ncbi:hypothetical protein B0H67DRAFT_136196 [Lasiosphaeris hirsuta]|uniref:PD-(D/E)XK nuclease-like domain-containing protein n=1 Tax=Lasiosphaeris hirsuta TaxID=260670 RepID=A0AA40B0V0_9PEZI|nr:hypothetical protein B0H67DRAFT_136196 [Lasiosphaeris hirsuta]